MTIASALTLGDIEFTEFEIPDSLPFGGDQAIIAHRPVGGQRILDAMGPDEEPIEWSGRIRGVDAVSRSQAINAMRRTGREYPLTWGELSFTVIIESFKPVAHSPREVSYSIRLQVVRDEASAPTAANPISATTMIKGDFATASGLTAVIADPTLTTRMSVLGTAIGGVQDFATASRDTLNSILAPVFAVQDQVGALISAAETTLMSVQGLGGIIPGLGGRDMTAGLLAQVTAADDVWRLYDVQALIGRIDTNVSAIGSSGATAVVVGADLFDMARQAYGNANEWTAIARANDLTDPVQTGIQELVIPPTPDGAGGVLS